MRPIFRDTDNELMGTLKLKGGCVSWCNRAVNRIFGYEPGELLGQPGRILHLNDEAAQSVKAAANPVLLEGGSYRAQLQMQRKNGSPIWVDISGMATSFDAHESLWMISDISVMKAHEARIEDAAHHDALTGLPNRSLLTRRLRQAIDMGAVQASLIAVCFIDLDGFKAVNDQFGHAAGDTLLQEIAKRLAACVRGQDTVARVGGDEFVVLLSNLQSRQECEFVVQRIRAMVALPVEIGGQGKATVSASIGVTFSADVMADPLQLVDAADAAMYTAKKAGKNRARTA